MKTALATIKTWFETGDYPTQEQFANWLDSFFHKDDTIPFESIEDLQGYFDAKANAADAPRVGQETLSNGSNDVTFAHALPDTNYILIIEETNGKAVDKANITKATDKFTVTAYDDNTVITYAAIKNY